MLDYPAGVLLDGSRSPFGFGDREPRSPTGLSPKTRVNLRLLDCLGTGPGTGKYHLRPRRAHLQLEYFPRYMGSEDCCGFRRTAHPQRPEAELTPQELVELRVTPVSAPEQPAAVFRTRSRSDADQPFPQSHDGGVSSAQGT